ncbi:MAG TPA: ferritin [Anaerolineae bacterium]
MLGKPVLAALNDQIKAELYSSYIYLAMSAHFESANLTGFAHWMRVQAKEELGHALKFYDYIHEQGAAVTLQAIDQPPTSYGTPLAVFQAVLEHEKKVTGLIHNLVATATKETDYATQNLLVWFVNEQVEEERNASQIVEELKMVGDSGASLFLVDRQLAARS